jgi:hypothetical protein
MVVFVFDLILDLIFFEADQDLRGTCDTVWDRMLLDAANEAVTGSQSGQLLPNEDGHRRQSGLI